MWMTSYRRSFGHASFSKPNDTISKTTFYQDNLSGMMLEINGKRSSSKMIPHIEICFFFVTDRITRREIKLPMNQWIRWQRLFYETPAMCQVLLVQECDPEYEGLEKARRNTAPNLIEGLMATYTKCHATIT